MGMTIDDAMSHIKYGIIENNYPLQRDLGIAACNVALDTMRKYQKIEEIVKEWRESGLLQDKFYDLINEVLEDGNEH